MKETMQELLNKQIKELKDAGSTIRYSYDRCSNIGIKKNLKTDQLESFEALTARFSRLSDLVVQKVLRTIDVLELEDSGTVRDRIYRAEKRGIIESADDFTQIRMLRNEIAHEYKPETVFEIFERVLALTPVLLKAIKKIQKYSAKFK